MTLDVDGFPYRCKYSAVIEAYETRRYQRCDYRSRFPCNSQWWRVSTLTICCNDHPYLFHRQGRKEKLPLLFGKYINKLFLQSNNYRVQIIISADMSYQYNQFNPRWVTSNNKDGSTKNPRNSPRPSWKPPIKKGIGRRFIGKRLKTPWLPRRPHFPPLTASRGKLLNAGKTRSSRSWCDVEGRFPWKWKKFQVTWLGPWSSPELIRNDPMGGGAVMMGELLMDESSTRSNKEQAALKLERLFRWWPRVESSDACTIRFRTVY